MIHLLAHITHVELPSFWLTAFAGLAAGFAAGVAVTYTVLARKVK